MKIIKITSTNLKTSKEIELCSLVTEIQKIKKSYEDLIVNLFN